MDDLENKAALLRRLSEGKSVVCPTEGDSMRPLLTQGRTTVLLEPIRGELKIGDMAMFENAEGHFVLHRVIAIEGDVIVTRGDNRLYPERNPVSRFYGVATGILYGRRLVHISGLRYKCYVFCIQHTWAVRRVVFKLRALYRRARVRLGRTKFGKLIKRVLRHEKQHYPISE